MHLSDLPPLVAIPFGNSAGGSFIRPIPVASQIGVTPGAASFTDGFPPTTFTPLTGGGAYVNGEDVNGILNYVTGWTRWLAAGAAIPYNSAFATAIGGYPRLAQVPSTTQPGIVWFNTIDGNLTDPDGGSPAGWVVLGALPASQAEVNAGTVTDKFVSPKTLHDLAGAVGDGQTIVLPGGFLLKHVAPSLNTGANVTTTPFTYATPFPSGVLGYVGTADNGANPSRRCVIITLLSMNAAGGIIQADSGQSDQPITNLVHGNVWALGN